MYNKTNLNYNQCLLYYFYIYIFLYKYFFTVIIKLLFMLEFYLLMKVNLFLLPIVSTLFFSTF